MFSVVGRARKSHTLRDGSIFHGSPLAIMTFVYFGVCLARIEFQAKLTNWILAIRVAKVDLALVSAPNDLNRGEASGKDEHPRKCIAGFPERQRRGVACL